MALVKAAAALLDANVHDRRVAAAQKEFEVKGFSLGHCLFFIGHDIHQSSCLILLVDVLALDPVV